MNILYEVRIRNTLEMHWFFSFPNFHPGNGVGAKACHNVEQVMFVGEDSGI